MTRDIIGGDAWPVEPEPDEALVEAVTRAVCAVLDEFSASEGLPDDVDDALARAAIAAVRAYDAQQATRLQREDLQRAIDSIRDAEPYRPAVAEVPPVLHPDGSRCECVFGYDAADRELSAEAAALRAAQARSTAVAGVPRCTGVVWRDVHGTGRNLLCRQPLGHHGGCR